MSNIIYRFRFSEDADLDEIEATLLLAIMGTESLHGPAQVRLDASHYLDREQRGCVIDASCPVGRDLARLFTGYALKEFGEDGFQVSHVARKQESQTGSAA